MANMIIIVHHIYSVYMYIGTARLGINRPLFMDSKMCMGVRLLFRYHYSIMYLKQK